MSNKHENNIEVKIEQQTKSHFLHKAILSHACITCFLYFATVLSLIDMFELDSSTIYMAVISVIPFLIFYFLPNKKWRRYIVIGFLIIISLCFFILTTYINNGLFLLLNQIADVVGSQTTYLLPKYNLLIDERSYVIALNIFIFYLFLFIAFISHLIVKKRWAIVAITLFVLLLIGQLYTGISPTIYHNLALFVAILLVAHHAFIDNKNAGFNLNNKVNQMPLVVSVFIIILFSITLAIMFAITPISEYEKNSYVNKVKEILVNQYFDSRYEKERTHSLTQGDFLKLHKLKQSNKEALEVIMSEPDSYYLRGFVGVKYTQSAWLELEDETVYEHYGLFHLLNEEGFNPLSQLSLVNELGQKKEDSIERNQITVNNIAANSKYLYIPYEFNDHLSKFEKVHYYNENKIKSNKYFGERIYSFEASPDLVTIYPQIANRLYKNKKEKFVENYLEKETFYNQYVYDQYTQLTEDVETILDVHFGKDILYEDEHMPYEQAIDQVQQFLSSTLNYNEEPKTLEADRDFVSFLIEESREGYSPHYATTATMLFRYLGIPARYVEGFLITPEMIEDREPYEKVTVTGKEAHAWTEIYFDEIGWIPIEVTPSYEDVMRPTDMTDYPKGKWSEETEKRKEKLKEQEEETKKNEAPTEKAADEEFPEDENQADEHLSDDQNDGMNNNEGEQDDSGGSGNDSSGESADEAMTEENEEEDHMHFWKILLIILLIILIILFIIYLVYVIKKRIQLRRLKQSFIGHDLNQAVMKMTSYSLLLFHYAGVKERGGSLNKYTQDVRKTYGTSLANRFKEVVKINQTAVYSGQIITEEQRSFVKEFTDDLLKASLKDKNIFQRIKMKFWDFIY